jgi:hypothetical protein
LACCVFATDAELGGYSYTIDAGTWGFYRVNGTLSPVSGSFRAQASSVSKNVGTSVDFMPGSFHVSVGGLAGLSGKPFDILIDFGRCAYVSDPFGSGSTNSADHFSVSCTASGVSVSSRGFFQSCYGFDYSPFIYKVDNVNSLSAPSNGRFYRLLASFDSPVISDGSVGIHVSFDRNFYLRSGLSSGSSLDVYDFILDARVIVYPDYEIRDLLWQCLQQDMLTNDKLTVTNTKLSDLLAQLVANGDVAKSILSAVNAGFVKLDDINQSIIDGNNIVDAFRSMVNSRLQSVLDYFLYAFFQSNSVSHENSWLYRIVNMFYDELIYSYPYYDSDSQEWVWADDSFLTAVSEDLRVLVEHDIQLDKVNSFGSSAYDKASEAGVGDMYDSAIGAGTASKADANDFLSGGLDSLGDLGSPGDLNGYAGEYYSWFSTDTADSLDSQYSKVSRGFNSSLPVIVTDYYSDASKRWQSDD